MPHVSTQMFHRLYRIMCSTGIVTSIIDVLVTDLTDCIMGRLRVRNVGVGWAGGIGWIGLGVIEGLSSGEVILYML